MQNKINNKWQWLRLIFLLLNILFPLRIAIAAGGIATDGTVGPAQTLSGTNVTIPQNLGTTVGKNLFHSFNQFNVNNGQTVTFSENTPNALDNVISRVTGGSASAIDGTLSSTPGGHANLYLVNPSGIVFGKNAQINVPGAFHASTADEVRFQDGAKFSASQPAGSTLTAAAPASFGFLGTSSATNGLLKVDGAQLDVGQGKKLDMVGRNISIENGAKLTAPEGEVRLEVVGTGNMNIPVNQPSETAHGTLALTKSTIDASGAVGGKVVIRGGDLKMSQNAEISANTKDKKNGTEINVHLTGDMVMEDGSAISARTSGSGNGGDIDVAIRGDMAVKGGGTIDASTSGSGAAGNIQVKANNLLLDGLTTSNGQTSYKVTDILSDANSGSTGKAGNVTVDVANRLELIRGGEISSTTFGKGDAGSVTVKAGQLLIDRQGATDNKGEPVLTGIFNQNQAAKGSTGSGGDIAVAVRGDMAVKGGGTISASTFGSGAAGNIQVKANNLLLDGLTTSNGQTSYKVTDILNDANSGSTGKAGNVTVDVANRLELIRGGEISSTTFGKGDAGSVTVKAGQLLIDRQGATDNKGESLLTGIFNEATKDSSGTGGNLTLTVIGDMAMKDGSIINANTLGSGKGGNIAVAVQGNMALEGGGTISASTSGSGAAGNIHVTANNLLLDGLTPSNGKTSYEVTDITSGAKKGSTGNAGNVVLDITNKLSLIRGGQISSSTFGTGNAGNIMVNTGQILIDGQEVLTVNARNSLLTGIFTAAENTWSGKAGDIAVTAQDDMVMRGGSEIKASTIGRGTSGQVQVIAKNIRIEGQRSNNQNGIITATAGFGSAGDIVLKADEDISIKGNSQLFSSTIGSQVKAGNISLTARNIEVSLGATIDSTNFTLEGGAGDIIIHANDSFHIYGQRQFIGSSTGQMSTISSSISSFNLGVGRHGKIEIQAPSLNVTDHALIIGTTFGDGMGSDIILIGKDIRIDSAAVRSNSRSITNPITGQFKIAQGAGGNIDISASNSIFLSQKGVISSGSSSAGNAGNITLRVPKLSLDQESFISTEAANSNGGNITINGGQFVQLINSGLKTSVHGRQGNSGNITINADNLVMETGLIQANTEAFGGSAGTIKLNIKGLIPSGQSLFKGGIEETPWAPDVFGLNVIEAVAPNGISGLVQSTAPQLDLSGVLSNLGMPQFDTRAISQDYCSLGTGSSLIRQGKGGLPSRSRDSVQY